MVTATGTSSFMTVIKEAWFETRAWLRQTRWIQAVDVLSLFDHELHLGKFSSTPEKSYKIIGSQHSLFRQEFVIFEFATNAWKVVGLFGSHYDCLQRHFLRYNNVYLNGNLYWTAYNLKTGRYYIRFLDFSKEIVKRFCNLPCKKKDTHYYTHVFAVYKGDRFSFLEQCRRTMSIEIWVTKKKISNGDDGDIVVWAEFMTVSKLNFPRFDHWSSSYLVDYIIYGKSEGKTKKACVYIVREDLCKNIKIDCVWSNTLFIFPV